VDDRHQVNHLGPKTRLRLSQTVARLLINADPPVSKTSLQYVWAGLHPWANKFQQSSLLNLLSAGKFSCKFFVSVFLGPLRWPKEQTSKTTCTKKKNCKRRLGLLHLGSSYSKRWGADVSMYVQSLLSFFLSWVANTQLNN